MDYKVQVHLNFHNNVPYYRNMLGYQDIPGSEVGKVLYNFLPHRIWWIFEIIFISRIRISCQSILRSNIIQFLNIFKWQDGFRCIEIRDYFGFPIITNDDQSQKNALKINWYVMIIVRKHLPGGSIKLAPLHYNRGCQFYWPTGPPGHE